ncbi:MAG: ATP-binding cassette domain-containing protein [Candidatus Marinimicrobia bacterium]|jgi:ABC-2 type transport system ATP-binding protein|nr:ATP-binding cassette domain-containing protein [Candidatus Neomarinimicrobiota bacterium]MBT3576996.1 ATP-binding cassette domain-containing protein [Candidatus Neomarinimicrobiota bacterium]MBT3680767.1 ATP-binding cassette domain-containing protein [Candidatus Neomarinimicrobiota bacterium]MBT3951243.1 ATP-binding cassette domain-containing protein [Candidatus Neomarinimicrobiota bacterium]MBT4252362.1 ATP-binding cassette domain-containing protein [Candidatus Neomarinimicrobiota bacterium
MIEIKGISKSYDSIKAVAQLDMTIQPGRIYGFLGPNGAGKTTAIRMLMNIIIPDEGNILFEGKDQRPPSNQVGYLPEERGLYQKISVFETLQYFAHLRSVPHPNEKIKAYLQRFDLGSRLQSKVSELSKGNQQKLQFINTILHDPQYIVLDEPFSGLDPVNQLLLKEILEEMKQAGKTIIFSSHQMDQVEKLCDDVALINQGQLVTAGKLKTIMQSEGVQRLQVTPVNENDLSHECFSAFNSDRTNGSVFIEIDGQSKQDIIATLNKSMDLKSVKVAEPGLEEIFIHLVQGSQS